MNADARRNIDDMVMPEGSEIVRVAARATVNLAGLHVGQVALVDPSDPYIADCLDAEFLVPVADPATDDS